MIKNVSDTAFMVAIYRAIESERPDALFHDPLARKLAGEHGQEIVDDMSGGFLTGWSVSLRSRMVVWTVAIRTCIIDKFIQSTVSQGFDAVLNLGAGLDTRPYRMTLPETFHWIEVDYPPVIDHKESRLSEEEPRCHLERVKLDLANLEERRKLFLQTNSRFHKVLVLTEGVVPYLSVNEAASLAEDIRAQNNFLAWAVDYFSPETAKYRRRPAIQKKMENAPFRFEPKDYFGFFAEHGWRAKEIQYFADAGENLQRPLPLPSVFKAWMILRGFFMSRERQDTLRKFAGYVLFEPALNNVPW